MLITSWESNKEKRKSLVYLGTRWHNPDQLPCSDYNETKRKVQGEIAKIYDPLGLAPINLEEKIIYKASVWNLIEFDQKLRLKLKISRQTNLPGKIEVPRSIVKHQEASTSVSIHAFGDASSQGMSRAVYAVMHQPSRVSQDTRISTRRCLLLAWQ